MEKVENVRPNAIGVRHLQTVLMFFGMTLAYMMRVNMSIAIVDMTDVNKESHFPWDMSTQSMILSSFFWGYVVLQIPSGELARWLGGKRLLFTAISVNSLISLLLPSAANIGGWLLVCGMRVLQGLTQAVVYPTMHQLISQWIPFEEKGLLGTIIYAGAQFGVAAQLMMSGYIAAAWGWPAIFYTNGVIGAVWSAAYLVLGSSAPERSKLVSEQELRYIQCSLGRVGEQKRYPFPWTKVLTSLPCWALVVAHCGQNWGFFTLMTEMPTYMSKVLGVDITKTGMLSSLPYVAFYLLTFPMGAMTDVIIRRRWLSVSHTRKLFNSIGQWSPALALIGLSYVPAGNLNLAVALLTITVGLNAGHVSGFILVHTDMAPNFSASLMGITNCAANIVSIVAPLVCGFIVKDETDPIEWRKVFFIASAVYFFLNLFFVLFGTSERQEWNEPKKETDTEMKAGDTNKTKV